MKIERIEYTKQLTEYLDNYGVTVGLNNNQRIILITLLCNITQNLRRKDPKVSVIDLIEKLIKDETGFALDEFLVKISFQCEALLLGDQVQFSDFGLKETKEKVDKIREIINDFLPF